MIPAPLLAFVRYAVVWECARLAAKGWTFFSFDPDTMSAVVDGVALAVALLGVYAAKLSRKLTGLIAHHPHALLDAAASVPGVTRIETTPALAEATASPAVVAAAQPSDKVVPAGDAP